MNQQQLVYLVSHEFPECDPSLRRETGILDSLHERESYRTAEHLRNHARR